MLGNDFRLYFLNVRGESGKFILEGLDAHGCKLCFDGLLSRSRILLSLPPHDVRHAGYLIKQVDELGAVFPKLI